MELIGYRLGCERGICRNTRRSHQESADSFPYDAVVRHDPSQAQNVCYRADGRTTTAIPPRSLRKMSVSSHGATTGYCRSRQPPSLKSPSSRKKKVCVSIVEKTSTMRMHQTWGETAHASST